MELLALVLFNVIFGIILYYVISIKVTNSVQDYQHQKVKKEIQTHALNFFKESESYLALMDSRITILKNLLQKAEAMGIDFKEIEAEEKKKKPVTRKSSSEELIKNSFKNDIAPAKDEQVHKPVPPINSNKSEIKGKKETAENHPDENSGFLENVISNIGKSFKSIMGMDSVSSSPVYTEKPVHKIKGKSSSLDVSIGGNPLLENELYVDNNKAEDTFKSLLKTSVNPISIKKEQDKIKISASTALLELPENASRVDKVVHLLKKGYSHPEISEELGLAIPEISLIETIKIEKNRRV